MAKADDSSTFAQRFLALAEKYPKDSAAVEALIQGVMNIGRTLCINPGSEYTEGTLLGALVTLADQRVASHQLVVG